MPKACFERKCNLFCSGCSKEFKSKSDLSNHPCNVKLGELEITIKTEPIQIEPTLAEHLGVEMLEENIYSCKLCDRTFKSSKGCKIHMNSHLSENREKRPKGKWPHKEKQYVCTYCPEVFTMLKDYRSHFKIHKIVEPPLIEDSNVTESSVSKSSSLCTSKPSVVKSSQCGLKTIKSEIYPTSLSKSVPSISHEIASSDVTAKSDISKSTLLNITSKSPSSKSKVESILPTLPTNLETTSLDKKIRKREYVCCNIKFHKLRDYRAHYKTHSAGNEIVTDGYETFTSDYETADSEYATAVGKMFAEGYLDKKIRKREYVCCNIKFQKLRDYRAHYKTHSADNETVTADNETVTADTKTSTSANNATVTAVVRKVFSEDYSRANKHECPNCSQTFQKIGSFRRHLRSHLNIYAYSCKHCLLSFLTKSQLIAHVKQKCRNREKIYPCSLCEKKFYHRMGFMQHKTEHISKPPYKCPTCGALFRSISRRVRHLAHHSVKCPVCCKAFANDFKLWQHFNTIHSDIVDCDIPCDMSEAEDDADQSYDDFNEMDVDSEADSFTSIDSSDEETVKPKVPMNTHLKKKNTHMCFICEQRFPKQNNLKFHLQSHKIYLCALCPKFFPCESKLKAHQSMHDSNITFDDFLHNTQIQPTTPIPIQAAAEFSELNTAKEEETETPHNILEWYNSFDQILGNLKYPIGQDLYLDINRHISEMTSALYNDNLTQETRDTYKKIYLRLTGIIRKNGESLCG